MIIERIFRCSVCNYETDNYNDFVPDPTDRNQDKCPNCNEVVEG